MGPDPRTFFRQNLCCFAYWLNRRWPLALAGDTSCPVLLAGMDSLNRGHWAGAPGQAGVRHCELSPARGSRDTKGSLGEGRDVWRHQRALLGKHAEGEKLRALLLWTCK